MANTYIPIIYASTSGNVESVCMAVADMLNEKGYVTSLHRSEKIHESIIADNQTFIFAASTWEHGVLNPFFQPTLEILEKTDLSNKKAMFIGLGDMRYEKVLFNKAIEQVREVFISQGGEQIGVTLKINGEPYNQIDTIVKNWVNKTFENSIND